MATDITVWWRAYGSADVNTDYIIQSDKATAGTFATVATVNATDRGDGNYYPYTSTLAEALDAGATSMTLTGVTGFIDGDRAKIEGETFILDGLTSVTFADCTPGADSTVQAEHQAGATVYHMHESYTDSAVDFTGRNAIRYRVIVDLGSAQLVAAECVAVIPTPPPTNDFCRVWGILDSTQGGPVPAQTVTLQILDGDNYNPRTAETFESSQVEAATDADGYWELLLPRDVAHSGGDIFRLIVDGKTHSVSEVPDLDAVCYLEII